MWSNTFLIVLMLVSAMHAFPEGAPTYVCHTMCPYGDGFNGHGVAGQTSENPYRLVLSKNGPVGSNDIITVRLEKKVSSTPNFLGFLIMAKEINAPLMPNNVIGTFSGEVNAQRTNCLDASDNPASSSALTHKVNNPVAVVTANWTAPDPLPNQPKFYVTVVQSRTKFWCASMGSMENGTWKQCEAIISLIIACVLFVKML